MAFPRQAFPSPSKLKRWPTYTPYDVGLPVASTSSERSVFTEHCVPARVPLDARHVPRAALHAQGVTSCVVMSRLHKILCKLEPQCHSKPCKEVLDGLTTSCITSEDITPPSSLLLAHVPDQNPPTSFGFRLVSESLQVAASHCWELGRVEIRRAQP